MYLPLAVCLRSYLASSAAFFFTDSMPFWHADLLEYPSLARMTCPLLAFKLTCFVFIDFKFASHDLLLCFELRFHVAGTF